MRCNTSGKLTEAYYIIRHAFTESMSLFGFKSSFARVTLSTLLFLVSSH